MLVEPHWHHHRAERHYHGERRERGAAPTPLPGALPGGDRPRLDRPAVEEPFQVVGQKGRRTVAAMGHLGQAFQADRREISGNLRPQTPRRFRLLSDDFSKGFQAGLAAEGRAAREQLVEDRAQAVHVGRRADFRFLSFGLLGRHVRWRARHGQRS